MGTSVDSEYTEKVLEDIKTSVSSYGQYIQFFLSMQFDYGLLCYIHFLQFRGFDSQQQWF